VFVGGGGAENVVDIIVARVIVGVGIVEDIGSVGMTEPVRWDL
jgi:hypothetical protein